MRNLEPNYRRNVALDVVLTLLMCGLWNIVVQYEQIKMLNALLKEERFPYWKIGLLVLVTCGIYLIFYEYNKSKALEEITGVHDDSDAVLAIILSILGFSWVWDAIFQSRMNSHFDLQLKLTSKKSTDLI